MVHFPAMFDARKVPQIEAGASAVQVGPRAYLHPAKRPAKLQEHRPQAKKGSKLHTRIYIL